MNDEINSFIANYRTELDRSKDLGMQNLENTRRNQFQNIMAGANKAGMMYSNFPERSKIQYDMGTYAPAKVKLQTTYQTGLDKLRSNTTGLINQLADINDAIADLNEINAASGNKLPTGAVKLNKQGDYMFRNAAGGAEFRDANGKPIRMGTVAKRLGYTTSDQVLGLAKSVLPEDEYKRLKNIYDLQANTSHPNFIYNVGSAFTPNEADYLNESDRGYLDSLGLAFGS